VGLLRGLGGSEHQLVSTTLIGRGPHCQLRLKSHNVSAEHASIRWSETGWVLRDLGSTNGTWINNQRLSPGRDMPLHVGDQVLISDVGWIFSNEDEPVPSVVPLGGCAGCTIRDGVIAVPDSSHPLASIVRSADGGWTLEFENEVRPIQSGDVFKVAEQMWTFWSPTVWQPTARAQRLRLVSDSTLHFAVSPDEEHVELTVEVQDEFVAMGHLSGYYFLLTLSRLRHHGHGAAVTDAGGWVHREELSRMLRCGEQQINVWVHRIRAKFSMNGFMDYANVIERRDGTGQMRVGASRSLVRST